jgi:hypothetical protein
MPPIPHAPSATPGWHKTPSQQPPLQVRPPRQLTAQTPPLHAVPAGQSAGALQPHIPPGRQTEPAGLPAQFTHVVPDPHAMLVDGTQVLPEQQKFDPQAVANVHVPLQPPLAHVGVAPPQTVQAPPT